MFAVGLLVIIGVVVMVVFLGRRSHQTAPEYDTSPAPLRRTAGPSSEVEAVLARAVEAGLLSQEAATAIVTAERERVVPGAPAAVRRVPPVAEAIGYVGSILVMVGMVAVVQRMWEDLNTAARLGIVGGAAALLFLVGALLRNESDEVVWRLRSFVWLLSAGALAGFTAILTVDALDLEGEWVATAIGAAVGLYSLALWRLEDRPAQQLTTFVGLLVMLGGIAAMFDGAAAVGLVVLAAGTAWLALGFADRLPPQLAALLLGSVAVLVGPAIVSGNAWEKPGPVIGLVSAIALVGIGTALRQLIVTGAGVAGLFVFLPWTLGAVFGDALGPPLIFVISGVLLLVVMFVLLRRNAHRGGVGSGGLGHGGLAPPTAA